VGYLLLLSNKHPWPYPPVFDLLIVALCARRLCFFLASRTSAYLLTTCGGAACFSDFAWAFGSLFSSNPSIGVVLIFFSLIAQNAVGLICVNLLPWNHAGLKKTESGQLMPIAVAFHSAYNSPCSGP
jgi:hypothetical protein